MARETTNFIVHKDIDKYGYIDADTKEWVIRPMFERAYDFKDGGGIVKYKGSWGIISSDLKWIFPPSLKNIHYDDRANQAKFWAFSGNKWGVMNLSGEWIIEPQFDDVTPDLYQKFAIVDMGGLKGIYDADFKCIRNHEYDSLEYKDSKFAMRSLSEYFIFDATKNGKVEQLAIKEQSGYSMKGEVKVLEPLFPTLHGSSDIKLIKVGDKYGVADNYTIIVPPIYEHIITDFTGFKNLRKAIWAKNDKGWHLYNAGIRGFNSNDYIRDKNNMPDVEMIPQGTDWRRRRIMSPKVTTIEGKEIVFINRDRLEAETPSPYGCFDLSIKKGDNGLYGLADNEDNWIVEPVYSEIEGFINGISIVRQRDAKGNEKCGLIDNNGTLIAKLQYDYIWEPSDGMRVFEKSNKCGVMTEDGKVVAKNVFLRSGTDWCYHDGRLKVKQQKKDGGKFGYLGTNGQWAIEPKFDEAYTFKEGKARCYINGRQIDVDVDGNIIPPRPYDGELDWQSLPEYTNELKCEIPEKFFGRPLVYISFSESAKSAIPGISIAFCTDMGGDFEAIVRVTDGSSAAKRDLRREAVALINNQWGGFGQGITLEIWQTIDFKYHGSNSDMVIESVARVLARYLVAKSQQPFGFDESLRGMLIFSEMGDHLDVLQVNDICDVVRVDLTKADYETLAAYQQ